MTTQFKLPSLWGDNSEFGDRFKSLHMEIDRVFDEFSKGFSHLRPIAEDDSISPSINVSESDNAIEVTSELPGVEEKDLDISLTDNTLTIKGEKKSEKEEKDKHYHKFERSHGTYLRSVKLPCDVESGKIKATFENGVLTVRLPKSPTAKKKTKKITIKNGK